MPRDPPHHKNPYHKRIKFNFDLSNNNLLDLSNTNIYLNKYFPPLQYCKASNNVNCKYTSSSNINYSQKMILSYLDL